MHRLEGTPIVGNVFDDVEEANQREPHVVSKRRQTGIALQDRGRVT